MNPTRLSTEQLVRQEKLLTDRLRKRTARLSNKGIITNDIQDFEELRTAPAPTDRQGHIARVSYLNKLDKSSGTRAATAVKRAAYDAKANERRDESIEFMKNPYLSRSASRNEIGRHARNIQQHLNRQRALISGAFGNTVGTHTVDTLNASLQAAGGLGGASRNASLSYATKAANALDNKTLSVHGQNQINDRATKIFGPAYNTWDNAHQKAAWDAMAKASEALDIDTTHMVRLIDMMTAKNISVEFTEVDTDFGTEIVATFDDSIHSQRVRQLKKQLDIQVAQEITERNKNNPATKLTMKPKLAPDTPRY